MKKYFILFLSLIIIGVASVSISPQKALAGSTKNNIAGNDSFDEEINAVWHNYGVSHAKGKMIFNDSTDKKATVVTRAMFSSSKYNTLALTADYDIVISKMPENAKFVFTFGLRYPDHEIMHSGSTSVYVVNDGGILKVAAVINGSESKEILAPTVYKGNSFNTKTSFSVNVLYGGALEISVNGEQILNKKDAGVSESGFIGFGQTAISNSEITSVNIHAYSYNRPENTNATADFTNDEYNTNEWYSQGMGGYFQPTYLIAENGQLVYSNVAEAFITTVHNYSNFELKYDITDITRSNEYDETTGQLIRPISSWQGVSMGVKNKKGGSHAAIVNAVLLRFQSSGVGENTKTIAVLSVYGKDIKSVTLSDEFNFWSSTANGKVVQLKIKMIDGIISAGVKYANEVSVLASDEEGYVEFFTHELGFTPLGFVQIWGMGHSQQGGQNLADQGNLTAITQGNFALDNISLKNKDKDANIVEVSFKSNVIPRPADYNYVDTWDKADLLSSKLSTKEIASLTTVGLVGAVGLIGLGKKKREGK